MSNLSGSLPPEFGSIATSSSLRPWIELCYSIDNTTENWSVPPLQPCVSAANVNVSCSHICQNITELDLETILDPQKPTNLNNCGLWRTASYAVAIGGDSSHPWLQQNNVEIFQSVGFDFPQTHANFSESKTKDEVDWATCFSFLWSVLHPNQFTTYYELPPPSIFSVPTPCDVDLIFGDDYWNLFFPPCIHQLCDSKGWLSPDVGGIGVGLLG